jgi:hypothetical protein
MKKYFLQVLLYWCLFFPAAQSQELETWFQSIDPNPADEFQTDLGKFILAHGNNLYLVNGYFADANYNRMDDIICVNAQTKEVVKQITLSGPQIDIALTDIVLTKDNHLLFTGEWRDIESGNYRMKFFIAKYTLDLEAVWTNFYPDFGSNYYYSDGIVEMTDGNILLSVVDSEHPSPTNAAELRLIKTDAVGNYLSTRLLEDTLTYTGGRGSITVTADSNYFVSSNSADVVPATNLGTNLGIMHKVNSEGVPLWSRELNRNTFFLPTNPRSLALRNGNQVVLWYKDTITTNPLINPDFSVMYCYDPAGVPLWTKEWNLWGYDGIYRIIQAANGDILGVGYFDFPGAASRNVIFRLNEAGEQIWERRFCDSLLYQKPYRVFLTDLCELPDGRIALTGISFDPTADGTDTNANVALLVLDEQGCLEPGCTGANQYVTETWTPVAALPGLLALRISPNPAGAVARVQLGAKGGELLCYSSSGALQGRFPAPAGGASVDIQVSDWPAGQYFLLHRAGGRLLGQGKLLVQH